MNEISRRGAARGSAAKTAARGPVGAGDRPRMAAAPDVARLTSVIEPILVALNLELEALKIASAGRRRVLRVVIDAEGGVGLDDIALASQQVSARLDAADAMGDAPYTLEVSSPGVDRPLTEPRHWRRAAGRLVAVLLTDADPHSQPAASGGPGPTQARVVGADQEGVTLEIDGQRRTFGYAQLGPGRVQVEFGRPDQIGDFDEDGEPGDGAADEEDRDGH